MDNRDEYAYGWNQQGERFYALKSGRREGRVNMIAALCEQNLIAAFTVEGACNRTVFDTKSGLTTPFIKKDNLLICDRQNVIGSNRLTNKGKIYQLSIN